VQESVGNFNTSENPCAFLLECFPLLVPPVVRAKQDIRRVVDALPEPPKSIVTLMVVGWLRIGEVTELRWGRIHPDRIEVVERFYEGEFDDIKTA
jgi:hypothetical protein